MTVITDYGVNEASIEELRGGLRGQLLRPGGPGYDEARLIYNAMIDRRPGLIMRCAGVADVISAVDFARSHGLPVAVRGGGHNVAGTAVCDGGLMIDLSPMKGLHIDPGARTVRAEPGLTWGEVNHDLQAFGLAAAGGFVSTTGVAGLTLGGGLGWLVRKHGLACDNLRSVDVVTSSGQLVRASTTENEDLFWGIRGGGGNFGVVVSFEFQVHPVGVALAGLLIHPIETARDVLEFWRTYSASSPEELTSGALLITLPPAPFVPEEAHGAHAAAIYAVHAGPVDVGEELLRPLREFGPPLVDVIQPVRYSAVQTMADDLFPPGQHNYWKSAFLTELSDEAIATAIGRFAGVPSPLTSVIIEHNGNGAMDRVGDHDTAFGHRSWPYNLLITSIWPDPRESAANITWTRQAAEAMRPYTADAVYVNYLGDEGQERVKAAYGQQKFERLVRLKDKYDPANLFRLNQNIPPSTMLH